jgi:outer membrane protein TolC
VSPRLALLALLIALPAAATDEGRPLSLAEATQRALAKNHDIALERESFHIASASLLKAAGSYDPAFHFDGGYGDHTDPVNSILSGAPPGELAPTQTGVSGSASLSQLLPTGGAVVVSTSASRDRNNSFFTILSPSWSTSLGINLRQPLLQNLKIDPARRAIRVARIERDRSTASLKRTVSDTVTAVEKAYWTLVAAQRGVVVRADNVRLADEQRSDTKTRIDVGTLPESDIAQPEAELERRKGDLYAAQEAARRAEHQLKILILDDATDPTWNETLAPSDAPETPLITIDLGKALKDAEEKRPELADASLRLARQDVELTAARDKVLPQLDLVAGYNSRGLAGSLNPNAPPVGLTGQPVIVPDAMNGGFGRSWSNVFENHFPDASIGLSLTVPILNRSAKADVVIARASRTQAAISLAQQKQRVSVEVRDAAVALQTAAQRIEAARAGRQAAETQLRAEKERFDVGLSTNFFVLTRQNDLAQAILTETNALTDYRRALTDFARSVGALLEERSIEIRDDAPAIRSDGGSR